VFSGLGVSFRDRAARAQNIVYNYTKFLYFILR